MGLMLNLNDLYYFVQVVDHKGFTAAARALKVPKSSLSRRVIELERQLSARLINRTSRNFAVSDVGQELFEHAVAMLAEARSAEDVVRRRVAEPSGPVRFTTVIAIAQFVLPDLLPRFMARFPRVWIIQHATDRMVDMFEENFDLAIRAHSDPLPDSALIARRITWVPRYLVASPRYLEDHPVQDRPQDLSGHASLMFRGLMERTWLLHKDNGERTTVPASPRLLSDDLRTLKSAAEAGLGIAALPAFACRADLQTGRLRRILPSWTAGGAEITLLATSRRHTLPAVRAFSDFLAAELPTATAP
jgi:DNA-binding transcriptional LysR family regulator